MVLKSDNKKDLTDLNFKQTKQVKSKNLRSTMYGVILPFALLGLAPSFSSTSHHPNLESAITPPMAISFTASCGQSALGAFESNHEIERLIENYLENKYVLKKDEKLSSYGASLFAKEENKNGRRNYPVAGSNKFIYSLSNSKVVKAHIVPGANLGGKKSSCNVKLSSKKSLVNSKSLTRQLHTNLKTSSQKPIKESRKKLKLILKSKPCILAQIPLSTSNVGKTALGTFCENLSGTYTLKEIINIQNGQKKIETVNLLQTGQDVYSNLFKVSQFSPTDTFANSYIIESFKFFENFKSGVDFVLSKENISKYGSKIERQIGEEKFLKAIAIEELTKLNVREVIKNNYKQISQMVQESSGAKFWRHNLTAIIPMPFVESHYFTKTAGTGYELRTDYSNVVSDCIAKKNLSLEEASICVEKGIDKTYIKALSERSNK